jgi:Na+-driven multidrug efflux pump
MYRGALEYQGILGSQANGAKQYAKVNLYFRQGLFLGLVMYSLFTILPSLWIDSVLKVISVPKDLVRSTTLLIRWSLPSMGVRIVSDMFKTFIVNQGFLQQAGIALGLNMIVFFVIAYLMIVTYNLKEMGMGLCVLCYELGAILFMYVMVYRTKINEKCKDTSIKLFTNFS